MKIPEKIQPIVTEYKDGKPWTARGLSEEVQKINEIIDYLEYKEKHKPFDPLDFSSLM